MRSVGSLGAAEQRERQASANRVGQLAAELGEDDEFLARKLREMIRLIDLMCGALLIVGAGLHVAGSFATYTNAPDALLWSLSAGAYEALLGGVNLVRASRRRDAALSWLSLLGGIVWLGVVVSFARLVGNPFDLRVVVQGAVTLVPTALSLRTLMRPYRPKHALLPAEGTRPRRRTARHGNRAI